MLSFTNYLELSEAVRMSPTEWLKPNSQTGESRTDILRDLINKGEQIELFKGGTVIITDKEAALEAINQFEKDNKAFELMTNKGKISSSHIGKTAVFGGGGGGSGGGTAQTKTVESAQCLWCAAMLHEGTNQPIEHFTEDVLKSYTKFISTDEKLENILGIDEKWKTSSYLSAKYLIDNNYIVKGMTFHRGDKVMKSVYDAKNVAYKNQGLSPMKDDKWNPGDIWAKAPSYDTRKLNTDSVIGLQKSILEGFVNKELVGISLKLVKKKAKGKEYNIQVPPDVDDYKVHKIGAKSLGSGSGDFWSSKGGEIVYDDGVLNIRDNSSYGTIKAEIKGKTARGGGASWGYIATATQQVFGRKLPATKNIATVARKIEKGDQKEMQKMYDVVKEVEPMSFEDFAINISQKDGTWIHAKYGVCLILYPLVKVGGAKANRFVTKIVNYAGSKTEDSSAYIKVYE